MTVSSTARAYRVGQAARQAARRGGGQGSGRCVCSWGRLSCGPRPEADIAIADIVALLTPFPLSSLSCWNTSAEQGAADPWITQNAPTGAPTGRFSAHLYCTQFCSAKAQKKNSVRRAR